MICNGIMDPGNYWRLENGKIDSSFSTILKLLERMNISVKEFTEQLDLNNNLYKSYEKELVRHFKNKEIGKLKILKETLSDLLNQQTSLKLTHLHALVDIYIFRIDPSWDAQKSKKMIKEYLAKCSNWNLYELTLLNNVLFIYDLNTSFLFYKTAAANLTEKNTNKIIPLSLNMLALCVEKEDKEKTQYLLTTLQRTQVVENNMYERTTQKWGIAIAKYYLSNHPKYLLEAEAMIDTFLQLNMKDTFNLYHSWTNEYKRIINT